MQKFTASCQSFKDNIPRYFSLSGVQHMFWTVPILIICHAPNVWQDLPDSVRSRWCWYMQKPLQYDRTLRKEPTDQEPAFARIRIYLWNKSDDSEIYVSDSEIYMFPVSGLCLTNTSCFHLKVILCLAHNWVWFGLVWCPHNWVAKVAGQWWGSCTRQWWGSWTKSRRSEDKTKSPPLKVTLDPFTPK